MNIKPIKNLKDYKKSIQRVEVLWNAKKDTKAGDEFEILSILIEAYEIKHYLILPPNPIEAIKFRLDQMGYEQKDLSKLIGKNRASEILNGKRVLSLKMIKTLRDKLKIPTEVLIA